MFLVDGSLFSTLSIGDPIERCREEVDDDADIIIDNLLCYIEDYDVSMTDISETRWWNAFDMYKRRKSITKQYYYEADLLRLARGYKDVNFRLIVTPREPLPQVGWLPISATMDDIAAEV